MDSYLYILPFNDNQHFKIGISDRIDSRIGKHNSQYDLNTQNVRLVRSSSHNIKLLERLLLTVCPALEENKFVGIDGATEIRHVDHLCTCLNQIDSLTGSLALTYVDYVLPKKEPKLSRNSTKKTNRQIPQQPNQ
jgi:hypothetical protein